MDQNRLLGSITALHLTLTALPGVAAVLIVAVSLLVAFRCRRAPLVMLMLRTRGRWSREHWTFALRCFVCATIGCLAWGLLLFGPPGPVTVMHAGGYALPMLTLAGCVAGLYAVAPQLAAWTVVCHSVTTLALYVPVLDPPLGGSFGRFSRVGAAAALIALACFAVVAFRSADHEEDARPELTAAASAP